MKNNKLIKNIFFLFTFCLVPFEGVNAEDNSQDNECLEKSCSDLKKYISCNVDISGFWNKGVNRFIDNPDAQCSKFVYLGCKDYLNLINIDFDVHTGDGATFEQWPNKEKEWEIGYRTCDDESKSSCEVIFDGKCKPLPTPECSDFIDQMDVKFNIETDEDVTFEKKVTFDKSKCEINVDLSSKVEKLCYYYGDMHSKGKMANSIYPLEYHDKASENLSCLTDKVNNILDTDPSLSAFCQKKPNFCDDSIVHLLTNELFGSENHIGSEEARENGSICRNFYSFFGPESKHYYYCTDGELYLDQNCNVINKSSELNECGSFSIVYSTTPISLVFEKDFDINSDVAFVNFDLDPAKQESWYTWKASNKAPLLVYDPEHTGRVNSAYQLFGEWTFGGKQNASLPLCENFTPSSKWENGFEALASLDRDFDGKLTGEELDELALWFDGNRDAISQEGEVLSLVDVGVTVLYFKNYKKDSYGDLRLDLGYEREIGGEVIRGVSIDWYGKGADSKVAVIEGYRATFSKPNLSNEINHVEKGENEKEVTKGDIEEIDSSEFRGLWDYFIEGGKYATPDGYLILGEGEEVNSIEGHSIAERIFSKSPGNKYHSYVGMFKLSGFIGLSADKEKIISFSIARDHLTNNTRAMLSKDKKTLIGTTTIMLDGGIKVGTYNWSANRHKVK